MRRDRKLRANILVDLHRLPRIHMNRLHVPSLPVSTDRNQRTVNRPKLLPDFLKKWRITGITQKINLLVPDLQHPAAPECPIAIKKCSTGKMLGRQTMETHSLKFHAFAPIFFFKIRQSTPLKPPRNPQRKKVARRIAQNLNRIVVEMIVMIVADHDRVDRRQLRKLQTGCSLPARPDKLNRRTAIAENRIGQNIQPVGLNQKSRVADPRNLQTVRIRISQSPQIRRHTRRHITARNLVRRNQKRILFSETQLPPEKIAEIVTRVRIKILKTAGRVVRPLLINDGRISLLKSPTGLETLNKIGRFGGKLPEDGSSRTVLCGHRLGSGKLL